MNSPDKVERTEVIAAEPTESVAALLDITIQHSLGAKVPPLWHWVYLLERSTESELGIDGHPVHAAEIDDDAGAQRAAGPVVPAAPHRQWEIALARSANRPLDVFGCPAVDNSARQSTDRLCPDRRCGSVTVTARHRNTAR